MLQVTIQEFAYQDKPILKGIDFVLNEGEQMAIIGESGCGKSTLLKLIYGLYDCDSGNIFWKNEQILGPKFHLIPGMSFMKYLAQDFDLMPYVTVGENVGKFLSNFYPEAKQKRIDELLELVDMFEYKHTKAKLLSGGQMQRVALAKVLAQEPEVLLLDEPFSHIDNFRKNALRRKIFAYLKNKRITTLVATHDSNDVLSFSDQVVVLKEGKIVVHTNPKELFQNPKNKYVASLFGDVNEIRIDGTIHLVYPHQLQVVSNSGLSVIIKNFFYKGSHYLYECSHKDSVIYFEDEKEHQIESELYLEIKK
ncbi:ABC transporter ATP-binding protein [Flavobacterium sp. 20NA77.7]|uniref:ABC transporter ATP-binding protein n=1 Tax=Flavobacterium nakdongensis TaxID=3073563 RepID=A0ABY9RC56_9FLAO|nr:ABC transporter ATP-binding protein [Flavobacterium sp. 20NA77.7]WMW78394.1 ABC transporter ATP-binding protein [Flavobacterium sp. 20NA77.7]